MRVMNIDAWRVFGAPLTMTTATLGGNDKRKGLDTSLVCNAAACGPHSGLRNDRALVILQRGGAGRQQGRRRYRSIRSVLTGPACDFCNAPSWSRWMMTMMMMGLERQLDVEMPATGGMLPKLCACVVYDCVQQRFCLGGVRQNRMNFIRLKEVHDTYDSRGWITPIQGQSWFRTETGLIVW